jgi:hypothetical protein
MSKNTAIRHGDTVLWQDMKSREKDFIITMDIRELSRIADFQPQRGMRDKEF